MTSKLSLAALAHYSLHDFDVHVDRSFVVRIGTPSGQWQSTMRRLRQIASLLSC